MRHNRLTLWSDECTHLLFLTRNAGALAHHPSSVLSPDDDDDLDDDLDDNDDDSMGS
jgi:hypothetical protein